MEINATNEACSTENENATHDTWFRLSLDLHTPHDRGGSNPDSNLSFSGTTPEAFGHALATILDVVTSTVYGGQLNGGQLNGLQEIIDHDVSELRASSEKAQDDAQQPKRNPALDVDTPKISTVTEPRPSFAPPSKPARAATTPSSTSPGRTPTRSSASAAQRCRWTTSPASSSPASSAASFPSDGRTSKQRPLRQALCTASVQQPPRK